MPIAPGGDQTRDLQISQSPTIRRLTRCLLRHRLTGSCCCLSFYSFYVVSDNAIICIQTSQAKLLNIIQRLWNRKKFRFPRVASSSSWLWWQYSLKGIQFGWCSSIMRRKACVMIMLTILLWAHRIKKIIMLCQVNTQSHWQQIHTSGPSPECDNILQYVWKKLSGINCIGIRP